MLALSSLIALASLVVLASRKKGPYLYLLAIVTLVAVPYVITSAMLRYRYPISSILIFLAVLGVNLAVRWCRWVNSALPTAMARESAPES